MHSACRIRLADSGSDTTWPHGRGVRTNNQLQEATKHALSRPLALVTSQTSGQPDPENSTSLLASSVYRQVLLQASATAGMSRRRPLYTIRTIKSTTFSSFRRANKQVGSACHAGNTHSQPVPTKQNRNTHSGSA
jgi:hypothetical protein